jgi:hypothetical protein
MLARSLKKSKMRVRKETNFAFSALRETTFFERTRNIEYANNDAYMNVMLSEFTKTFISISIIDTADIR